MTVMNIILSLMHDECSYSFWDLFEAANKRQATVTEKNNFQKITQEERNKLVKKWAKKASWGVDDRVGSDGKIYTAFCPLWNQTLTKTG